MEEGGTNREAALELDFNSLPIPYHNMALSDHPPWFVRAHHCRVRAVDRTYFYPRHHILALVFEG